MTTTPLPARAWLLAACLCAGPAVAQSSGGFAAGDVYLASPSILSTGAALLRVNPYSGATSTVLPMPVWSSVIVRTLSYDPFRDRVILQTQTTTNNSTYGLWAFDAQGAGTMIAPATPGSGSPWNGVAPTGDGRLYLMSPGTAVGQLYWLDAGNQQHTVLNAAGSAPYQFPVVTYGLAFLVYDAASNALFTLSSANQGVCTGGNAFAVNVFKVTLSPDGTRALSTQCTQYLPLASAATSAISLSPGPAGSLMLAVYADSPTSLIPTLATIDPATLSITPYASPTGGTNGIRLNSAVYSHATHRVLATEFFGTLHAIGGGQGPGTQLGGPLLVSGNTDTTMVEVGTPGNPDGLSGNTRQISLQSGGTQTLTLALGPSYGGHLYFVLGSLSGYAPGLGIGTVHVPLNVDNYLLFTLSSPNQAPLANSVGVLSAQGTATCTFSLPPNTDASLAGLLVHHAALSISPALAVETATNPVALLLVP